MLVTNKSIEKPHDLWCCHLPLLHRVYFAAKVLETTPYDSAQTVLEARHFASFIHYLLFTSMFLQAFEMLSKGSLSVNESDLQSPPYKSHSVFFLHCCHSSHGLLLSSQNFAFCMTLHEKMKACIRSSLQSETKSTLDCFYYPVLPHVTTTNWWLSSPLKKLRAIHPPSSKIQYSCCLKLSLRTYQTFGLMVRSAYDLTFRNLVAQT